MSSEQTYTITALPPGTRVVVENYRSRYKPWEPGVIKHTEVSLYPDGTHRISYNVTLDRCTVTRWGERPLWLYVGEKQVKEQSHAE